MTVTAATELQHSTPLKISCKTEVTRPTQFKPYTSLPHIAFTNTIFVYFVLCLLFVLYVWPAFCHPIIKRILMMMMMSSSSSSLVTLQGNVQFVDCDIIGYNSQFKELAYSRMSVGGVLISFS